MESYREEIEKEAEEYWRLNRCENKGFLVYELFNGGINSKIAHRIKIDFAVECLQDILFETERFISDDAEEMILKKITELKNKNNGK
jgi:hypothetical protein